MNSGTVPVRIGAKRYQALRKAAKRDGHSILWLLNYIVDLYLQEREPKQEVVNERTN